MPEAENNISGAHEVILCLGSNCGDRTDHIRSAADALSALFVSPARMSDLYETPCCKGIGAAYLNAVLYAVTRLDADELCSAAKDIEKQHGRTPESKLTGIVPLDIDIVVADSEVLRPRDVEQRYFQLGYNQLTGSGLCLPPLPDKHP